MINMEEYIKNCNIISTKYYEKIENSLSIYDILSEINNKYKSYKEDFKKLPDLKLNNNYFFDYYCESIYFDFKMTKIVLNKNEDQEKYMLIIQNNSKIKSTINTKSNKDNHFIKDINYSNEDYDQIFNFSKKYASFFPKLKLLKEGFTNQFENIIIAFNLYENVNYDSNYIKVSFGIDKLDYELLFKLGNEIDLININSKEIIDNNPIKKYFTDMIKNIYIHKDYLTNLYSKKSKIKKRR